MNFKTLIENLKECKNSSCSRHLQLENTISESRVGLGTVLMVQCECGFVNRVPTSSFHNSKQTGRKICDLNTKLAEEIIHCSVTTSAVIRLISLLGIPPPDMKTIKRREREIEPVIESVARDSCKNAMELEVSKSCEEKYGDNDGSNDGLTVRYDMGWQRRSSWRSCRSYNSKSGHGVLIGQATGKILDYGTKISNCKQCERNPSKKHDCRTNWHGSSKAMEAQLGVDLVKRNTTDSIPIQNIVTDEDSTTISRIKKDVSPNINKISDINHVKKIVGNSLYALKNSFKILSTKVISYLQKCFAYSIAQNKGDPEGTKKAIKCIVPHIFGEHDNCGDWCKFKTELCHIYKSLPYGKCLTDITLRNALTNIFEIMQIIPIEFVLMAHQIQMRHSIVLFHEKHKRMSIYRNQKVLTFV